MYSLDEILRMSVEEKASDIHLQQGVRLIIVLTVY